MSKAAQSIKERKLRQIERCFGIYLRRHAWLKRRGQDAFDWTSHQLIFERASLADDDDACDCVEQNALFLSHGVRTTNKNSSGLIQQRLRAGDRKSTRLNSSHGYISYAVFCLKKKKK